VAARALIVEPQFKAVTQRSLYLTMRDGVKIAVTVVLPKDCPPIGSR